MPLAEIPAHLAKDIKLVCLDVDGVLTDNGVYIGQTESGERVEMKRFDILDGLGIKMLMRAGVQVAFVSGRFSVATSLRAQELGVDCHQADAGYKMHACRDLMQKHSVEWQQIAWVGDDLPDLAAMRRVGLAVAVGNAVREIQEMAAFVLTHSGGDGAVREFAETLLRARGEWDRLVDEYVSERS